MHPILFQFIRSYVTLCAPASFFKTECPISLNGMQTLVDRSSEWNGEKKSFMVYLLFKLYKLFK